MSDEKERGDNKKNTDRRLQVYIDARIRISDADHSGEATNTASNEEQAPQKKHRIRRALRACVPFVNLLATIVIAVATTIYAIYAGGQWQTMQSQLAAMQDTNAWNEKTFRATQHAAVALGLPDGKFIDFAVQGEKLRVVLYFRNYGASIARNALINIAPVITSADAPSATVFFPPIPPEHIDPVEVGPDIPPGFQHTEYLTASVNSQEQFADKKVSVKLIGRILYKDEFGPRCDTFSAVYDPDLKSFRLRAGYVLCDGKPHEIFCCDAKNVLWEAELYFGPVRFECTPEGLRTVPEEKNK